MRIVALALVLALAACEPPPERRQLTGTFSYAFELNHFEEVGRPNTDWCLTDDSVAALGLGRRARWMVAVDLTADVEISAPGRYGHMGTCTREVRITRLIEQRGPYCPLSADACARIEEIERQEAVERGN